MASEDIMFTLVLRRSAVCPTADCQNVEFSIFIFAKSTSLVNVCSLTYPTYVLLLGQHLTPAGGFQKGVKWNLHCSTFWKPPFGKSTLKRRAIGFTVRQGTCNKATPTTVPTKPSVSNKSRYVHNLHKGIKSSLQFCVCLRPQHIRFGSQKISKFFPQRWSNATIKIMGDRVFVCIFIRTMKFLKTERCSLVLG
jgi:hypothetical protein